MMNQSPSTECRGHANLLLIDGKFRNPEESLKMTACLHVPDLTSGLRSVPSVCFWRLSISDHWDPRVARTMVRTLPKNLDPGFSFGLGFFRKCSPGSILSHKALVLQFAYEHTKDSLWIKAFLIGLDHLVRYRTFGLRHNSEQLQNFWSSLTEFLRSKQITVNSSGELLPSPFAQIYMRTLNFETLEFRSSNFWMKKTSTRNNVAKCKAVSQEFRQLGYMVAVSRNRITGEQLLETDSNFSDSKVVSSSRRQIWNSIS